MDFLLIISFANQSNIKSMLDKLTSSYKDHQFYLTKRQDQLVNKTQKKSQLQGLIDD